MNKLRVTAIFLLINILFAFIPSEVFAASTYTVYIADPAKDILDSGSYKKVKAYSTFSSAYTAMEENDSENAVVKNSSGKVIAMKNGMIITKESESSIFIFTSLFGNGYSPYTSLNQVGYYIENESASKVKLSIAGFTGTADVSDMILVPSAFCNPYNEVNSRYEFDYYTKNSSGDLVHYLSTYLSSDGGLTEFHSIVIDKAPDFMVQGERYYSTDGYIYYASPIDAVRGKNEVGRHSIYYKNLSYRSVSEYTKEELSSYLSYRTSDSVYKNAVGAFIEGQEKYGVNAAMEMAFANHESAYGTSSLAKNKYNFFGVGAEDAAFGNANTFVSPSACILNHMKFHMSRFYFDAYAYIDSSLGTKYYDVPDKTSGYISKYAGDPSYFGTNPGDKNVGVNVRYASDPFHGEKVAGHMYAIDKYLGMKDYGKYSIGKTNKITYAYREPDSSSWKLYKYSCKDRDRKGGTLSKDPVGMMVTIIGEEGDFYKVLSDMPVNKDGYACYTWDYDRNYSYAYVPKSDIDLIYDRGNLSKSVSGLMSLNIGEVAVDLRKDVYEYSVILSEAVIKDDIIARAKNTEDVVEISDFTPEDGKITKVNISVTDSEGIKTEYTLNVLLSLPAKQDGTLLGTLIPSKGEFTEEFVPEKREYTLAVTDISGEITFEYVPLSDSSKAELTGENGIYMIIVTSSRGDVGYYRIKVIDN